MQPEETKQDEVNIPSPTTAMKPTQPVANPTTPLSEPQSSADTSKKPKRGSLIAKIGLVPLVVIAVLVLGGGSVGAYFGLILPNNPENLWKTSMATTAKGLDKYIEYEKSMENVEGSKFSGSFSADASGNVYDGTFEGVSNGADLNMKADIGAAGSRVNLELMANTPDTAKNPDIYMRVQGLDGISSLLGVEDPETSKLLATINNQWYLLDHTFLDQMQSTTGSTDKSVPSSNLSGKDIVELETAIAKVTKEYILTTSPDKAVMTVVQNVGSEELNGRKTYHYRVGVNKDNTKEYLTALQDELKKTKLGASYLDTFGFDEMIKEIDKMPDDSNVDVWVDKTTKLVRSIKFIDRDHQSDFFQVSLNYDGVSKYPVELKLHTESDGKVDATLKIEQDTEKKASYLELSIDAENDGDKVKASAKMTAEVSDEEIKFTKPADAKSVYELLGGLMGGGSALGDSTDVPSILDDFVL